jgi:hypothetical protein
MAGIKREWESQMKRNMTIIYGVFVVLLVLQSALFSILLVQYSDSKTFRLLIGFIGIGLLIVMPVMSLVRYGTEKQEGPRAFLPLVAVITATVLPWVPLLSSGLRYANLYAAAVPVAALSLSAAIGGSAINAIRISAMNPDGVSAGMRALRWALSLLFLFMALNIFLPAFARLAAQVAPILGLDASIPVALAFTNRLWETIFLSISNVYVWMLDFAVALWASMKFYRVFFS